MKQWMAYCKGCGKLIVWTKMQSGKAMPCDPEVIRITPDITGELHANETFITPEGMTVKAKRDPESDIIGYVPHWATCPKMSQFKGKG